MWRRQTAMEEQSLTFCLVLRSEIDKLSSASIDVIQSLT